MNPFVIEASVAAKWVIEEPGTPEAVVLRERARLVAPDLLAAECANILWKKVRRQELTRDEAILAARLLQGAEIELLPADERFVRTLERSRDDQYRGAAISLNEAVASVT